MTLSAYDYSLKFRADVANNADALSRRPLPDTCTHVIFPQDISNVFHIINQTPVGAEEIANATASVARIYYWGWPQPHVGNKILNINHGVLDGYGVAIRRTKVGM